MPSHQLDYEILDMSARTVEIILAPEQTVIAEVGPMNYMTAGFRFATALAERVPAMTFNPREDARGRGDN